MKKYILPWISLLILILSLAMLSSCGEMLSELLGNSTSSSEVKNGEEGSTPDPDPDPDPEPHTHRYGDWIQEADKHYKSCACGQRQSEERHTPVSCGISAPTFLTPGISAGTKCEICDYRLSGEKTLPAFSEACVNTAYLALGSHQNGEALQAFYTEFYDACVAFHTSDTLDAEKQKNDYVAVQVSYGDNGLSNEEASLVWEAIRNDCPIFYWIGTSYQFDGTHLYILTDEAYASGAARAKINADIYEEIQETPMQENTYLTVLYLHDMMIDRLSYAYESDGVTPKNTPWAHSIHGYFAYDSGVCECYAETFSLFLNYFGIENYYITGKAGGAHAWNLVKMDDGRYYWFDLTWDDQPSADTGRIYDYFCQTDEGFGLAERTIDTKISTYPKRSETAYESPVAAIGEHILIDGMQYQVIGFLEVELTCADKYGAVEVPEEVVWKDITYTVTSIGRLENNTLYSVFEYGVSSVSIPKSVKTIRGNALTTSTLKTVTVAEDSPYLISEDGMICTKKTHILLAYLPSVKSDTLTLRPDIVEIASFSIIGNKYITTLEFGIQVKSIDRYAISRCENLTTIRFHGSSVKWRGIVCGENAIPEGVTVIFVDDMTE